MNDLLEEKLKLLPSTPGVYKMLNADGEVIYVGKAISLKNRVHQYFQSNKNHSAKVIAMVQHIADFETIQVRNETEALSLECNLIKQFQPKYNILLKDDKHFPYVRINLKQDFPRIEIVRKIKKDGAKYLGPFLSAIALRESMDIIQTQFPIRHCKKDLSKAIARHERPCLMYHVGKCCAPCSGNVTRTEYHAMVQQIISFLNGDTASVLGEMKQQMQEASDTLNFEKAANIRDRIKSIQMLEEKQAVIGTSHTNADIFAIGHLNEAMLVFAMFVRDGKVIGTEKYRMDVTDETDSEIMSAFLKQFYSENVTVPSEILLHTEPDDLNAIQEWLSSVSEHHISVHRPLRGDKVDLTSLCYKNCIDVLEKEAELQKRAWGRNEGAVVQLAGILGLESVPKRIECFDNSHIQGVNEVSSMVVFTDGIPDKKAYRRFKLRSVNNGDDLLAMKEVLSRRFHSAKECDPGFENLPDLLVIDGGSEQLAVATEILLEYGLSYIPAIALAESDELIYTADDAEPISLPKSSAPLQFLQRIRDEAHRFAISYHRTLHENSSIHSLLDEIPSLNEKSKRALLTAFSSIEQIKNATNDDLSSFPFLTKKQALFVYKYFHPNEL